MKIACKNITILLAIGALAAGLAGCGGGNAAPAATGTTRSTESTTLSGTVTVFAAASLKSTFTKIAADFEAANPGTKVTLNFAGSSDLVTQITQGAPADVFASADTKNMTKLIDAKLIDGTPTNFATNVLQIAVPPSNPASISSFADLSKPGVKVVVCAPEVPCGSATETIQMAAGTTLTPVSEESSVSDVLGKVTSQEADAGLVYVSDVKTAGDKVKGIPFTESDNAVNTYPVATVGATQNKDVAQAFIAAVTGAAGKKVLTDAGFGTP
ncbi:molybdate ABC transporter substrate-binding protein [Paenarthrobacter sp. TA1.8]|uniref:molybdate ABC transporter substrate-binding protein n=1 Tax=Paenarthrobacter sp. TA1.8 TaxID=3400219 RepID=UPI003B42E5A0